MSLPIFLVLRFPEGPRVPSQEAPTLLLTLLFPRPVFLAAARLSSVKTSRKSDTAKHRMG